MKVSRSKLRDKKCRTMAQNTFKTLRQIAKQIVQIELPPLYIMGDRLTTAQCQGACDVGIDHITDYIWTSLKNGGEWRYRENSALTGNLEVLLDGKSQCYSKGEGLTLETS